MNTNIQIHKYKEKKTFMRRLKGHVLRNKNWNVPNKLDIN